MFGHDLKSGSTSPEKSQTPNNENSLDPENSPISPKDNNLKLIEAKTAVILLKTSRLCTKNEYTQWLLKMLYQPCSRKEDDGKNVLYLSRSRRKIWATDFSIKNQDPSRLDIVNKHKDQLYVITPKTTIMTLNQENRLVYIIDLSSSLATVGNTRSDILLSEAFQTLKNSLEGLVQPFSMQVSPTEKAVVQPSLRLTVMADCSQFASNVNVIPMLAEHPTMRVFMQNIVITANNIRTIIRKLRSEFLAFQEDTTQFRKFMKRNRANMGYNLDVGNEVAPPGGMGVLDATSFPKQQQQPHKGESFSTDSTPQLNAADENVQQQQNTNKSPRPFLHASDSDVDLYHKSKETSYHSSKKEVWGIGKSGANLSRILHAGHFALKFLPRQGRAQLILITDGAMKSNVHDNTFVRQFAEEDITCHIIQIGYANSFIPCRNFGFVPDTEILQFLARATCGTFMYSEKCLTRVDADIFFCNSDDDGDNSSKTPTTNSSQQPPKIYPVVQFVNLNKAKHISTPNIYHRQFLFRETVLTRHHQSEFLLQAEKDNGTPQLNRRENMENSNNELRDRFNFPWDPYAKPPEGDWRLLKYREYPLPAEFSHIIAARAREGFTVQSVTFDDGSGSKHVDSGIHDLEVPDFAAVRKERIQIVMIMRWQPNVSIEYRIRATWLPTVIGNLSSYKSEDLLMSSGVFSRGKAPRAEIFVRTDAGFAHMLQNWDVFKRRAQMMGVVTGSIYFGETYAAPVYSKIEKLKSYLVDIYEADEVLKTVIAFPSKFWMSSQQASTSANGGESGSTSLASSLRHDSQSVNTMSNRFGLVQQKIQFIDSFKEFWERFNNSDTRARTRCWYDPDCIDLLVGDVSPYMAPKLASTYNQDFVSNVEEDILAMVENVKAVMRDWADFEAKDGTFVRMMHKIMTSPAASTDDQIKDYFTTSLAYPPSFCELRVRHEYGRLITLRLLFFNVEVLVRKRATEYLIHLLKTTDSTKSPCNMICKRPFSRLLMRDPKHFADAPLEPRTDVSSGEKGNLLTKNQSRSKAWYLPVAMWLTSEYIVRDYLRHMTWSWQTDNHQDIYHKENKMMPIHDLAFQFLCQARLDQGYQLVSPRPDSTQFYQEISLPSRDGKTVTLCAIQYYVWKDSITGRITTELWMEPSGSFDFDQYELVKRWTFEPDRKTISQLVTFDQIHAVGRSRGIGDFKDSNRKKRRCRGAEVPDEDTEIMLLPQLFDVASVLRSNKFIVASFQSPQYKMITSPQQQQQQQPQVKLKALSTTTTPTYLDESSSSLNQEHGSDQSGYSTPVIKSKGLTPKTHRYLRRRHVASNNTVVDASVPSSPVPPIDSLKLFSYRPDVLLNKNKEVIAKLDVILQNYALLHYFVERSLDNISSGEIFTSHHDVGAAFWQDLKNALQSVTEDGKVSNTGLIPDLRKTRCFVKIFDPRSFVLILFPSLESVSTGLLKLQEENEAKCISLVQKCKFLDIFMFECVRQKPMKPTKNDMPFGGPLNEANRFCTENVIEDADEITIKRVEHLIHESDGLGVMLRPELFKGEYSTCQNEAQLTDRVLRVAQDVAQHYSQSFLKSFYTCLMRGFMVDDDDLSKVLEVCNESSMEIDITEFVNTMTMQKHESLKSDVQDAVIQGKFNAIFHQYFESLQTKNGAKSNLFYYKPPFNRDNNHNPRQENMSIDERISYLVDLVAHSQAPLLIRLSAAYKTVSVDESGNASLNEIVVPVTSLPTSYSGQTIDGKDFDLEVKGFVNDGMFPLNTGKTKVYLQIVCLNMTRSALDDYIIDENIMSSTSESLIQSMQSQPEYFSSLSQDQQFALAETDSRVNWLLKEETIHGLLKTPTITLPILKYVEFNLSVPNPYVDYQTSITLPFQFVKNNAESRLIFMNELEKDSCCQQRGKYQLKRLGDYFYVCEDSVFNIGDESSYSNSTSPVVPDSFPIVLHPPAVDTYIDANSHDDLCDGLGISISKFVEREEEEEESKLEEEASTPLDRRPLYWLILIPQEKFVQIYYYSKVQMLTAGPDILNPIKEKIKVIQERTNRLSLLNYLQETRMCSKYLEAPSDADSKPIYSDEDDEESDNTSDEISDALSGTHETIKFFPSQFSCPMVYSKCYPLHWRLQPNVALKFLSTDVLRLFTVINRPNMFVIERDGSIVYCKIYEETIDGEVEGTPETVYGSPVQTLSGKNTEDDTQTLVAFNTNSDTAAKRELTKVSSTSPRPRGTNNSRSATNEKRELVLEVYGIDLPSWIEKEFVNLIENRLISQITLNEIQQYFVRNSTSKPTAADVEFILPTKKPPTHREMLRVPGLVSRPYTLLQYFKQTILADNIRQLTGPHVKEVVETYYNNVFFTQDTDAVQDGAKREFKSHCETTQDIPPGAFCFYYNCTKRLPGASSALELLAGQGIAGICLTLLDERGVPITIVKEEGNCGANFDPESIRHCLEEEFREATTGTTYHHIWVDIWTIGAIDGDALMQHIYECYRRSLCDYFIEKTVNIDLGAALSMDGALQKAVSAKYEGRLGTVLRKKFIESVLFILRKAAELKSPTVCSMDSAIQTTPWSMDDLVRYLDVELRKIDPSLRPTVAWTSLGNDVWGDGIDLPNSNSKWELYRGFQYRQRQKLQSNIRLVAISGLDEFVEKLGSVSDVFGQERRSSVVSDADSQRRRSRRSSGDSMRTDISQKRSKAETQDQSRASSALSNSGIFTKSGPQVDTKKHCFMIMTLDVHRLSIYTYNWSESVSQDLFNGIFRVASRQEARGEIMANILHQKMGLFHHTEPMKSVVERFATSAQNTKSLSSNWMSSSTTFPSTPHINHISPKGNKMSGRQYDSTNKLDATPASRTPGSARRNTNNNLLNVNTTNLNASMLDLKDMVAFPTSAPSRESLEAPKSGDVTPSLVTLHADQESHIDRILQNSSVKNAELDHALMDSITDSVADTIRSKDLDILRRHGQPFLEAFLRRAKVQSAHCKALKVYKKWRKRYGNPEAEAETTEGLSRPEVSTIMRSSRVLHFCRTPLIFCDPEKDWSNLQEGSSARFVVIEWFQEMGNALMAGYAKYLEGADMQLLDFAKSEGINTSSEGESTHRTTKFNLGKKLTTECPSTYLLRVFEGGSIICEIRLTSVFVSVTLYTLHRQYGRLDYNRFRRETRTKKRSNFKKFEENSGHFKQMIHINSFVYDFQLQYIQKMLENESKLPSEVDIMYFIRRFARINQQPSPYSKDRILHGFYQFEVANISDKTFFDNLLKNAPRHGLLNVPSSTCYSGACVTSKDLSFISNNDQAHSDWKYTLLMCPTTNDDTRDKPTDTEENGVATHKMMIEYFILVVYQGSTSPESMTKANWVRRDKKSSISRNLCQISLPEEGITLADIVSGARKRLDGIVSEVIERSKRVHDWETLYSTDLSLKKNVRSVPEHPELIQLMSEFDRVDITEADSNLAAIFNMKLDWNAALNTVKIMMKSSSKDFHEGGRRHLLLYSARYMDFMIHLRIDSGKNIQGWLVSREKRTDKTNFEGAEKEQMASLGKIFYYYMWRVITDKSSI